MISRRKKKTFLKKLLDIFWPSIGLKRFVKYTIKRLDKSSNSPYKISAGFACGAAISFTPFIGLHFILSALFALLIRSSVIASAIGTVVGNPLTFPFIWVLIYETGVLILNSKDNSVENINTFFSMILGKFSEMNAWYTKLLFSPQEAFNTFSNYLSIWEEVFILLYPLIIGCIPWFIIVWFIFFVPLHNFFKRYKL